MNDPLLLVMTAVLRQRGCRVSPLGVLGEYHDVIMGAFVHAIQDPDALIHGWCPILLGNSTTTDGYHATQLIHPLLRRSLGVKSLSDVFPSVLVHRLLFFLVGVSRSFFESLLVP